MEKDNPELESLLSEALGYYKQGVFDKAITIHMNILSRYKDNGLVCSYSYASIGDIYLTLGKLDLAEDYLKKALGYEPLNAKYHYLLGFTYSKSKSWDKAIKEFEVSLRQKPEEAEYLRGLGWATWNAGDKARGIEYLKQAIMLDPNNVNILTDLAVVSISDGDVGTAQEYAERAVNVDPKSTLAKDVLKATYSFRESLREDKHLPRKKQCVLYEMKVSLKGARPAIWRRFRVSGNITFYKLHRVLQEVMGWSNYHLYEFRLGGLPIGEPDPEYGREIRSARRIKMGDMLTREKEKFIYIYDFGDGWQHEVTVERIIKSNEEMRNSHCTEGEYACPPEDCGGIGGYANLLNIIRNPVHEEHERMMEWLGGDFDPNSFDIDEVNRRLKALR